MEWLEITQIVTLVMLVVSEVLGVSPVQINGLADALLKLYQQIRDRKINASA
jgi:hypothetical protein